MTLTRVNHFPTVFVIDDDPAMQQALRSVLTVRGIPLRVFGSAKDFLEAYRDDWAGCLLVDILMPGMDGLVFLKEMQSRGSTLPAILMTGHADQGILQRTLAVGGIGVLEKPFRTRQLLDFIGEHCPACLPEQPPSGA